MSATAATGLVTAFLDALSSGFNWALEKLRLNNSAVMQANAAARTMQNIKDESTRAVQKGDVAEVRKLAAE
jgi:hypothetical protein